MHSGFTTSRAFLDGVNVLALGFMVGVTFQLGRAGLVDWLTIVLTIIFLFMVFRPNANSAWLILGGAALGVI